MASLGGNQKMNVNSGVSTKVYFSEFSFFDLKLAETDN